MTSDKKPRQIRLSENTLRLLQQSKPSVIAMPVKGEMKIRLPMEIHQALAMLAKEANEPVATTAANVLTGWVMQYFTHSDTPSEENNT